jgi:hypothetical protein
MPGGLKPCPFPLGGEADTGWSPEQQSRACADLAALANLTPFAVMFLTYTTSYIVTAYRGMNGSGVANAPTVISIAGQASITWDESYQDDYGVSHPTNLLAARACPSTASNIMCPANVATARGVIVKLFTANSGAAADSSFSLVVW